ncbi:anaerobic glycerol-3-phosphate dehydrogenase subunit GlpC [Prevotella sp. AGR2160]|uniref:anaerobic glycerol-3-phosphate dehydrogenase subunit GlpC n=1 Tax=Prevotella sp. AGR2160 TaxID=1280674 RepID=UPI00041626AD|nr:anaerobic glycerol-3-phosphate dehydrogenase subunit GlpC [Prevotella sp. AGR2160]
MLDHIQLKNISAHAYEQCLKCSICTVYCPVSAVEPNYPGPKHAGPDLLRYRLKDPDYFNETLKLCLNCKRCEVACPHGVKVGDIIQEARIQYSHHSPSLRDRMLANTDFVGSMATMVAPLTNFFLGLKPAKYVLDRIMKIDEHRQFPAYSGQKFETWFHRHAENDQRNFHRFVGYFHGCYVNYNFPKLGQDFVKIMNACGYGVHLLEKEKCCGVALIANGLSSQAKRQGEVNMASMRKSIDEGNEAVLTTSSTCTFTMRDEYKDLLKINNDGVRSHLMLATRFLCQLIDEGKIKLAFRKDFHKKVAYHTACHMERMGWAVYSIRLLQMIPGLDLTVLESQCCGIAGTYGFKKENYERSQKIGAPLFKQIKDVNPQCVATDCETCKWQIEMSTGYPVENPISLIADALDVEKTKELNK